MKTPRKKLRALRTWDRGKMNSGSQHIQRPRTKIVRKNIGKPGWISFSFMLLTLGCAVYYVWVLRAFISNYFHFFGLLLTLIILSFLTAATEAAFSRASRDESISQYFDRYEVDAIVRQSHANKLFMQKVADGKFSIFQRIRRFRIERKIQKNKVIKRSLDEENATRYVGALASLGVFLNSGIASFLPVTMLKNPDVLYSLNIFDYASFSLEKQIVFVFVSSSLPLLIFGKIVPKALGLSYPQFFGINFNFIARIANVSFGWMAKGVVAPLEAWQRKHLREGENEA